MSTVSPVRHRAQIPARLYLPACVLGILMLAIAVRFAAIGSRLDIDEAYSWWVASASNAHVFLSRLAASENTPPLFYLALMTMPGSQPLWLRIPAVVPGVLLCVAVFAVARSRLGVRVAVLAALAVAVSPYLITYSDLARGFMLADLAQLLATWALLSLCDHETRTKWAVYVVSAAVAVWAEYASLVYICALGAAAVWLGRPRRSLTIASTAAAVLSLLPWVSQIIRGQHQVGVTKFDPLSATPSLVGLRDMVLALTFGEHGGVASAVGRWLLFIAILSAGITLCLLIRRRWAARDERSRYTLRLLAAAAVLTPIGYAVAAPAGVHIFSQRYATILIPVLAIVVCAGLMEMRARVAFHVGCAVLVALGLAGVVRRFHAQFQPDLTPARLAAASYAPRTLLTNTPVVSYYLRSLHPVLDRPYNLGPGRALVCARPCVIVDDTRVPGGTARPISARAVPIGPFLLYAEH